MYIMWRRINSCHKKPLLQDPRSRRKSRRRAKLTTVAIYKRKREDCKITEALLPTKHPRESFCQNDTKQNETQLTHSVPILLLNDTIIDIDGVVLPRTKKRFGEDMTELPDLFLLQITCMCVCMCMCLKISPYDAKNPFLAPVHLHRELHKSGDRSCMHIEFDITGSKIRYDAGDHVAVYPVNSIELVEKLGKRLDVDLGLAFTLTNVDGKLCLNYF